MPRAPGCRWAKVRQAWCCPPWNCRSYKRAVPDEEAARPDRAVPSGYPRRRWQPGPRASARRGAPRMTPAGQDRRARGWAGPATGAARAGGHPARPPRRPPDPSKPPRAVRTNAWAREGLRPPRPRWAGTPAMLWAQPRGGRPDLPMSGRASLQSVITCVVEYVIDPAKIDAFERFAQRWMELVNLHGGTPHGYFLPAEGASDNALALFSFPSLAAYEQYRALFGKDPEFVPADRIRDASVCVLRYH